MTLEERNKKIVLGWIQNVFNQKKMVKIADYKEPVSYHSHTPFPGTTPNLDGFKHSFKTILTAFPDFQFGVDEIVTKGDVVIVRGTWTGTHQGEYMGIAATGKQISVTRLDMLRLENGFIVEHWGFGDDWHKIRQMTAGL